MWKNEQKSMWEVKKISRFLSTGYGILHSCGCKVHETYTCQVSRLRRESHACGLKTSISRRLTPASRFLTPDWKMSCCRLAWHNLEKYVNSDPCEEGKTMCKMNKWQYLRLPRDLWLKWKALGVSSRYTRLRLGLGNVRRAVSAFVTVCKFGTKTRENVCASPGVLTSEFSYMWHLRMSSEDFGLLRKTSDFFGNVRKRWCHLQKSQHSQDKNLTPISQKKLAGIETMVSKCELILWGTSPVD